MKPRTAGVFSAQSLPSMDPEKTWAVVIGNRFRKKRLQTWAALAPSQHKNAIQVNIKRTVRAPQMAAGYLRRAV